MAAAAPQPRVRWWWLVAAGFAVAAGLNAVMPTYPLYALSLIPVGLAMLTLLTSANTAVQMSTEPQMRGRVMASTTRLSVMGSTPLGALLVGWIRDHWAALGRGYWCGFRTYRVIGAYLWGRRTLDVQVHYHWCTRPHVEIVGPREHQLEEDEEARIAREVAINQADRTPGDQACSGC